MVTHLTLHALGPASAGAALRSLGRLLLSLLLQFEVLRVQVVPVPWTQQCLIGLLDTLKGNKAAAIFKTILACNRKQRQRLCRKKKYLNATVKLKSSTGTRESTLPT